VSRADEPGGLLLLAVSLRRLSGARSLSEPDRFVRELFPSRFSWPHALKEKSVASGCPPPQPESASMYRTA